MTLNQIVLILVKIAIVIIYIFTYYKFKVTKRVDETLKFRLNLRSKIEFYGLAILNVVFILATPNAKETAGIYVIVGGVLFVFSFLHLERLVIVGRKIIFARFLAFEVRKIKRKVYERSKFTFYISNGSVYVKWPVSDMTTTMEMLSGKRK